MAIKKENKWNTTIVTFESEVTEKELAPLDRKQEQVQITVSAEDKKTVDFVLERYNKMRRKRGKKDRMWPIYQRQFEALFIPYADWRARSNVPLEYAITENFVAEAIQRKTLFELQATNNEDAEKKEAMNAVWDYDWTTRNREKEILKNEYTTAIFGSSVLYNGFEVHKKVIMDPDVNELWETTFTKKMMIEADIIAENCDLRYFYADDRVDDFEDAIDCVYIQYLTPDFVQNLKYNGMYKNIDQMTVTYKKDIVYRTNEETYDRGDIVELMHYWNKESDEYIVVMNRQVIIRQHPNPYAHKQLPFTIRQYSYNPNSIYGRGLCEILTNFKSEINNLKEMIMDWIRRSNNSVFALGGDLSFDSEEFGFNNSFVRFNGQLAGNFQEITAQQPNSAIFNYLQELYRDIAIYAGIDPSSILWQPSKTAFEVAVQTESSLKRVNVVLKNRDMAMARFGKMHLSNLMQFFPLKMARGICWDETEEEYPTIPIKWKEMIDWRFVDKEGVYPFEVTPESIRSQYDLEVRTNLNTPTLRQLERENYTAFFRAVWEISQIATTNQDLQKALPDITKEMAFKFGVDVEMLWEGNATLDAEKQKFMDAILSTVQGGQPWQEQTVGGWMPPPTWGQDPATQNLLPRTNEKMPEAKNLRNPLKNSALANA